MAGLALERAAEALQRLVVFLVLEGQDALGDEDVGLAGLAPRHVGRGQNRDRGQQARGEAATGHSDALRPSAPVGRWMPQPASLVSTVLRWTPSRRAPRLTFQRTLSSTRSTYCRSN